MLAVAEKQGHEPKIKAKKLKKKKSKLGNRETIDQETKVH